MKKSNYRSGNETMINYYNKITAKLDEYKFEDLDILRTETSLFINNDIEHFTIKVTITHKAPTADIEKFFNIMEQDILPGYMESFYNTKDFKVILFDESGKTQEIVRTFNNEQIQIKEEKSEEEEL
jgi:hypothetical protein